MKIKNLLILLVTIISVSSCTFTEEIHIKKDGSGDYAFKMDMSKMMEAMGDLAPENDSIKKEKKPEKQDTTFVFKDILEEMKDSISKMSKEEQEVMKSLENLKVRIQADEAKKQMSMDFLFDFKNIADLKNMNDKIQRAQALSDKNKKKNNMRDMFDAITDVEYTFKDNVFKRIVTYKEGVSQEKIEQQKQMLSQSSEMLDESTYKIIYHFDNKIKSVSLQGAKISDHGKTLTIEMPMDTILKNPFLLNFEVTLK